jgi:hypothetical protein
MRMSDAGTSEAARSLAAARWGNQVLRRSVGVVLERADGLTEETRAELEQIADRSPAPDREK